MKILWSSNAPWVPSGYGQQTRLTVPRLKALGHDVGLLAWCGLEGGRITLNDTPVYPKGGHPYGVDVLGADAQDYDADIAITLIDAWVYNPQMFQGVRWCPYFPIDSEPVAPGIVSVVSQAYERIVFSKFACEQMEQSGLPHKYVPHMIDCSEFKPGDGAKWRKMSGTPDDCFVVGMVAANKGYPSRKSYPQAIEAFARFNAEVPNARLYIHGLPFDPGPGGSIDIPSLLKHLDAKYGTKLANNVMWSHAYQMRLGIPSEYLRDMYSGIDVLLSPSMGEGFGIPIVEAQACETPVIVGDWTAMSELRFAGWAVGRDEADPFWITGYNTYQMLPRIDAITDRLHQAYAWSKGDEASKTDFRQKARQGAMQYDCDKIIEEYWKPTLDELNERISAGHGELKLVKF